MTYKYMLLRHHRIALSTFLCVRMRNISALLGSHWSRVHLSQSRMQGSSSSYLLFRFLAGSAEDLHSTAFIRLS